MYMKRYYFDYAAATPLDSSAEKAMRPYGSGIFGNPGSLHSFGQEASAAVFEARDTIAKSLGCHYSEIIFTGSATEANNLALRGVVKAAMKGGIKNPKIITSQTEHDSVLGTCRDLEGEGVEVIYLPVNADGIVDLKKLEAELNDRTVLVSIMLANNEIGVIQSISKVSEIIRNFREAQRQKSLGGQAKVKGLEVIYPLFHTDAVQGFNYLNCKAEELGADLLTLSAQKIYGPKGIGLLYARQNNESGIKNNGKQNSIIPNSKYLIHPIITGGGQERGFRSGTENVSGIIGFAKAVEVTDKLREKENKRLSVLQKYFLAKLKKVLPQAKLNGGEKNRLPNNINIYVPPKPGEKATAQDLVINLDLAGFAVSPGSACSARTCSPSHVLKALGHNDIRATSSIRITFGRQTDKQAVNNLLKAISKLK